MTRVKELSREMVLSAWNQKTISLATILVMALMCITVILTAGKTAGAQRAVLSQIDSAGSRSIVVRADPSSGITSEIVDQVQSISGVEWVAGFGPAADMHLAGIPGGTVIPVRPLYINASVAAPKSWHAQGSVPGRSALLSANALSALGLDVPVGGLESATSNYNVTGTFQTPSYVSSLEPLIVVPQSRPGPISVLVVVASKPELVTPLARVLESFAVASPPRSVRVQTSDDLAQLQTLIDERLSLSARSLLLATLALAAVVVSVIFSTLVLIRRRDFGRRRALGATRSLIALLVFGQITILTVLGLLAGNVVAAAILLGTREPLPAASFFAAVSVLAGMIGLLAAVIPAVAAAQRNPVTELRVP